MNNAQAAEQGFKADGAVSRKTTCGVLARLKATPAPRLFFMCIGYARLDHMTPDVVQAWLMRSLGEKAVASLMEHLALLILDEAHTYEGVFGTNMAYLLRRFEVAANRFQMLLSTATLNEPQKFATKLTGRSFTCLEPKDETSSIANKKVLVLRPEGASGKSLDPTGSLVAGLAEMARQRGFRFLAFADSRKVVERVVVITQRLLAKLPVPADYDATDADQSAIDTGRDRCRPKRHRHRRNDLPCIAVSCWLRRGR